MNKNIFSKTPNDAENLRFGSICQTAGKERHDLQTLKNRSVVN